MVCRPFRSPSANRSSSASDAVLMIVGMRAKCLEKGGLAEVADMYRPVDRHAGRDLDGARAHDEAKFRAAPPLWQQAWPGYLMIRCLVTWNVFGSVLNSAPKACP